MSHKEHTELRVYELGYHLVPTIPEEKIPEASGAVRGMIEKFSDGGAIIAEELPVFIDLAYQVVKVIEHKNKRFDDAYFGWIKFESSPEGVLAFEEALKKDENVLRYLVVKTLKESTYLSKKFPSSTAKIREEEAAVVAEEASVVVEAPEEAQKPAPEAASGDELDKVINELVS